MTKDMHLRRHDVQLLGDLLTDGNEHLAVLGKELLCLARLRLQIDLRER